MATSLTIDTTRMSSLRLFLLLGICPFPHLLIDQILLHFMLFFTVFVLSLYSYLIILIFISIFNFSPYSIYLHCMNIIYLSLISQYHIIISYSIYLRFSLFLKYGFYSILKIHSIFDLSS